MTPQEFVAKWSQIHLNERATAQSHFNDVCRMVGHPLPLEADPSGADFAFETRTVRSDGRKGFADVFYRGKFIWEYKGAHKDLGKAYQQLLLYREALESPPLLITSDMQGIFLHTNFTNRPVEKHEVTFKRLLEGDGLDVLRRAFFHPESFMPTRTQQAITLASAETFVGVADAMKKHQLVTGEHYPAEQLAHFMARLLFCLFAEDMELLPRRIFSQMVKAHQEEDADFRAGLGSLFQQMRQGGLFGMWRVPYFNGTLFDDGFVPELPHDLAYALLRAIDQDWREIDPSIFGTLFERVIDERKRSQLGAHYTGREDIESLIEPVVMAPLRHQWREVRLAATAAADPATSHAVLAQFAAELGRVRVLDPACGSGNFLYVALHKLLDLQKEVIITAEQRGLPPIPMSVTPQQLWGIEINPYAYELAQITMWIGYLQWRKTNGFTELEVPILQPLHNIQHMDAILAYDEAGNPTEPAWPPAEFIVGNPPFLGHKKHQKELGVVYTAALRQLYPDLTGRLDLVCYWFKRAWHIVRQKATVRVGFLSTNSIRKGASNLVLQQITAEGTIFWAWSDRAWVLEGAAVRISMVGFGGGTMPMLLDGQPVTKINPDLTHSMDITKAKVLAENKGLAFIGTQRTGPFDITEAQAADLLAATNPSGRSNRDVVKPWVNASDITQRNKGKWIIDFGTDCPIEEAQTYQAPFAYLEAHVKPYRFARSEKLQRKWWLFWCPRPTMRRAIAPLQRYIVTPLSSTHRVFAWMSKEAIVENTAVVIAREDDYFWGVLHSMVHETWSLRAGNWLGQGNDPRYTPTTTFLTFPFPWPPGQEPSPTDPRIAEIGRWAQRLHDWREAWLNPPPPNGNGGRVLSPAHQKLLAKRTLTNLYNGLHYVRQHPNSHFDRAVFDQETNKAVTRQEIEMLHDLHTMLDRAVLDAYGWPHTLSEAELLARLVALNEQRAAENGILEGWTDDE